MSGTTVIYTDSQFFMWFAGSPTCDNPRIGRANSQDGIAWLEDPLNPILIPGLPPSWDELSAFLPRVIKDGNSYTMWYSGDSRPDYGRIGRATSLDGRAWQKDTLNPVMNEGGSGAWDQPFVGPDCVLFDGTVYKMWYDGGTLSVPGQPISIGYATSPDGVHWTRNAENPVLTPGPPGAWDEDGIGSCTVIYASGYYHLWYTGDYSRWYSGGLSGIGYAVSPDGVHWKKFPGNPVLRNGLSNAWDQTGIYNPVVILAGSLFTMWYSGYDGVGSASSTLSPPTLTLTNSSKDFLNVSSGDISDTFHVAISNWGVTPLVLSTLSHQHAEFVLSGFPSFPITIPPFEEIQIDVVFHPSQPGQAIHDTLSIASNDALHPVTSIALRGRGSAPVAPPMDDVAYAIAVSGTGVQVDTLDLTHATGRPLSTLSPRPPPDVQSLAVRRFDGMMYGLYSTPTETRIYRISSRGGDIEFAGTIPLGDVRGIYFTAGDTLVLSDSTGRLFGMKSLTSPPFRIDSSGMPIYSFAKSPTTGQLWGVSQNETYKFDRSNWGMTPVGTLPGLTRPSIAFGKYGTLYGLFEGNLFEIDRLTGVPRLIGATGDPNLRALVIQSSVVGAVEELDPGIPLRFALRQNFPNPFNPSTTIEFDLPLKSYIQLKVYDVLGRFVATLADEELPAGKYSRVFSATGLASGVYFVHLQGSSFNATRSLILLR